MTVLSILDLSPVAPGRSTAEAIEDSVLLAQTADALGYHRAWYAEHHNFVGLASGSPELMIGHVASRTQRIRVGSGGIMLPNHAPLRIAEAFKLLEAMHPGRIDLGLGRAPGTDGLTASAMGRPMNSRSGDDYPDQLDDLIAFGTDSMPAGHKYASITAIPAGVPLPPIFLLGSSDFSAIQAADLGLGYAFAAHINFPNAVNALSLYRSRFRPSAMFAEPRAILALNAVVGASPEHVGQLRNVADLALLRLATGRRGPYATFDEAQAHVFAAQERAIIAGLSMRYIAGEAEEVRDQILHLQAATRADEIMLTSSIPFPEIRRRAITLLAEAFALGDGGVGITPAGVAA